MDPRKSQEPISREMRRLEHHLVSVNEASLETRSAIKGGVIRLTRFHQIPENIHMGAIPKGVVIPPALERLVKEFIAMGRVDRQDVFIKAMKSAGRNPENLSQETFISNTVPTEREPVIKAEKRILAQREEQQDAMNRKRLRIVEMYKRVIEARIKELKRQRTADNIRREWDW